jgi:diaminopimelate decarboxylase
MSLPAAVEINSANHLAMAGVDLVKLAGEYGTPLYVYNEDEMRKNCRLYREALERHYGRAEVIYAGKAFLTLAMCRLIYQEGLSLDVVSGGELYTALPASWLWPWRREWAGLSLTA